jgi:hypothetical protein
MASASAAVNAWAVGTAQITAKQSTAIQAARNLISSSKILRFI